MKIGTAFFLAAVLGACTTLIITGHDGWVALALVIGFFAL